MTTTTNTQKTLARLAVIFNQLNYQLSNGASLESILDELKEDYGHEGMMAIAYLYTHQL